MSGLAAGTADAVAEAEQLGRTAEQVLARFWERPARAAAADLDALWSAAADCGWFDLEGSLPAALAVVRATGRFACPLPVMDAFVAGEVLSQERPDLTIAVGADAMRVVAGDRPPDDGRSPGELLVPVGSGVTHVLELSCGPGGDAAALRPVLAAEPMPGLAVPSWHRVRPAEPDVRVRLEADTARRVRTLRRLGLAAHALAAVARSYELALEHAKVRRQFGKVVGGFGGVQQRLVDSRMELSCAELLLADAGRLDGAPGWPLAAELAVAAVRRVVPRVQFAAHQTLAAVGFYEEHDAPWLFRSAHADLARIPADTAVADLLAASAGGAGLPEPALTPAAAATRDSFRAFLATRGFIPEASVDAPDDAATVAAMGDAGWFALGWPSEFGGRAAGPDEQAAVQQEVFRRRVPVTGALAAAATVGGAIIRHGTPEQGADLLPRIARGELAIAVGYSEPDAGSDLAALRTRAVRDGDGWLISGQKAWTSDGHRADHLWLAARTDPEASPPHAGITLFLVPAGTAGITIRPDIGLSGQVACTVFLDEVRVPDSARVGPVDGGWRVLSDVLTIERTVLGGIAATAHRQLDDLVGALAETAFGEPARLRLTELAARVQGVRLLATDATAATGGRRSLPAAAAASAVKVLSSELAADLALAAVDLLGPRAVLAGSFEKALRLAPGSLTAGGTNDVHRGLVARALGLPV